MESAEATGPGIQGHELWRREAGLTQENSLPYNMPPRSASVASGSPAPLPMQSLPQDSIDHGTPQGQLVLARQTKYEPFRYQFADAVAARDYRRQGTRFERLPYRDPDTDETIAQIEHDRNKHVMRIYNAMTSGEAAKDNRGSIAMKRWVMEAHYPPELVEAYAHKVFDCLLSQVKEGFRGWVHNDYVADERKGEDIDKDIDCAGRLDNVIQALEQEKTICEDVMNSACQIRMFVNAPRAYANRKHQNRVGNSKRGRTKDTPDPNPKAPKVPRTGNRRTRARSNTAPDMPPSQNTTPQQQQQQQPPQPTITPLPYYIPASQPSTSYPPPRSTPHHMPTSSATTHSFFAQRAMSSPSAASPHAPQTQLVRTAFMHPQQLSPLMSPPPLSHSHYPTPGTPDEAKPQSPDAAFDDWQDAGTFGTAYGQGPAVIDPMLTQWGYGDLTQREEGGGSQFFDHTGGYVNPCDIERRPSREIDLSSGNDLFNKYWSAQQGVQEFPATHRSSEHKD
jgi:hypothetical protein